MSTDRRDLQHLIWMAESRLRDIETRIAVKTGFACPEPGCGLRYRHQHNEVWWPPEGEPWPPCGNTERGNE